MAGVRKFTDAQLLRFIFEETETIVKGPSIKRAAKNFDVAYQSMSERAHRLVKAGKLQVTANGLVLEPATAKEEKAKRALVNG
jgi:hypothetical protein